MTTSTTLNEYIKFELQNEEDERIISNAIHSIQKEFINYYSKAKEHEQEQDISADYSKILNSIVLSVKSFANSSYKTFTYLEDRDVEQIKSSLNNYTNNNEKITEFKKELMDDLTAFQKQIRTNHVQKLAEMEKQKRFCEKQTRVFEFEKNKLIMDRLSKIIWPYDAKTKEYENKIANLHVQIQKYEQKIEQLQKMRPNANEKDILLYQMHLKEKYAKK